MITIAKHQEKWVLIPTILASSMGFIDGSALNVALPALQKELALNGPMLLWIINAYALPLSALLLVGGALGDHYGRKKVFMLGIIIFAIASLWCGFANSAALLIASRALQGVGGALMVPGSLSLISALFPEQRRGSAIGLWSMFSAMATILGPALGGVLAENGYWRAVFFINIPFALLSIIILSLKVPESKASNSKKLDLPGALWAVLALSGITFGFIEGPERGWDTMPTIVAFAVGLLGILLFIRTELNSKHPMMPFRLFTSSTFSGANAMTLLVYGALGGFLFFFPLNLIQVQGYAADTAGLTMLPFGILIALLSGWSGKWSDRIGIKTPLVLGPTITGIGFLLFYLPGVGSGFTDFWTSYFPAILLLGTGMGITVAPLTTAVMKAADNDSIGIASGINNTIARSAGVLAIAVMGAFGLVQFRTTLMDSTAPLSLPQEKQDWLMQQAANLAETSPPPSSNTEEKKQIAEAVKISFLHVFKTLTLAAAALCLMSAFIAYRSIRSETGLMQNP